jgi:hypothetical protein
VRVRPSPASRRAGWSGKNPLAKNPAPTGVTLVTGASIASRLSSTSLAEPVRSITKREYRIFPTSNTENPPDTVSGVRNRGFLNSPGPDPSAPNLPRMSPLRAWQL